MQFALWCGVLTWMTYGIFFQGWCLKVSSTSIHWLFNWLNVSIRHVISEASSSPLEFMFKFNFNICVWSLAYIQPCLRPWTVLFNNDFFVYKCFWHLIMTKLTSYLFCSIILHYYILHYILHYVLYTFSKFSCDFEGFCVFYLSTDFFFAVGLLQKMTLTVELSFCLIHDSVGKICLKFFQIKHFPLVYFCTFYQGVIDHMMQYL